MSNWRASVPSHVILDLETASADTCDVFSDSLPRRHRNDRLTPLDQLLPLSQCRSRQKDAAYSQQHVQERALERYGLELIADDYRKLNEAVQRARDGEVKVSQELAPPDETEDPEPGVVTLLNDEGGDEQIWGVGWGGKTLVCVWSISLARVTTLLPEGTVVTRRKGTKARKGKK
ncbi:hypothetical protein MSAN_01176000 [Mycena sanguinolenta]|uniref:Uncharacterized protein n=1 Tax=Mycena sanguinolenta TaxID=230812 RepID=A0A8H6YN83_9AGAR|nr:hypothetical protein MSAN_01176000 [Mycena sanguinolenta]